MKIAIDFDGTICKRNGIPTIMEDTDEPVDGAKDAIKLLLKQGHDVWVFTSNPYIDDVSTWLEKYGFPDLEVTNIKKPAHVYIDDRALRFTNWQDMRKYFV